VSDPEVSCDRWVGGLCRSIDRPTYCPVGRAEHSLPGECCHHPLRKLREAGVDLARYDERLRADPGFASKLYLAWTRARSKRSARTSRTPGRS